MNILILGNGGREHVLAWKINQSPKCNQLFIAPGNAGTGSFARNIDLSVTDFDKIGDFCLANQVQMVVVGPEAPLVAGIKNFFKDNKSLQDISIIGPDKSGATLEGSKDYSKYFMNKYNIPTAQAKTFSKTTLQEGLNYLTTHSLPIVLKADGLAAGKGVMIANTLEEAQNTLRDMIVNERFGTASDKVLVEQYLTGIELSVFVLTDGNGGYVILPEAKDYKRIGDGDTGPNTGGMGAVSPVIFANNSFMSKVEEEVIQPTINGLINEGIEYTGFLFIGLMNVNGDPYVIEYNVRMGDPETQAVIPRVKNDLVELLEATASATLDKHKIITDPQYATTVVMVSEGYPSDYQKGKVISGTELETESLVFHAGTISHNGQVKTNGGRVIAVTTLGSTLEPTLKKTYQSVSEIKWEGVNFRSDIGKDLLTLGINQ